MTLLFAPSVTLVKNRRWNGKLQSRYSGARLSRGTTIRSARMNIENEVNTNAATEKDATSTKRVEEEAPLLPEPPLPQTSIELEDVQSTGLVAAEGSVALDKEVESAEVVTKAQEEHNQWLDSLLSTVDELPENHPLAKLGNMADVKQNPPTRRVEDWRFTDLRSVYAARYDRVGLSSQIESGVNAKRHMDDGAAAVLVFLDGVYSAERSLFDEDVVDELESAGGRIGDLGGDTKFVEMFDVDELNGALQRKGYSGMFPALNSRLARDAAVIDIPSEFEMTKHIVVLCVASTGASANKTRVSAPRIAIHAAPNSKLNILECHESTSIDDNESHALVLASTAVRVERDAKVKHYFANVVGDEAQLLAHSHAYVESGGTYSCTNLLVGGRVSRLEATIKLIGEGAHGEMLGAAVTTKRRVADLHSRIEHTTKRTTSNQLQKNIASDRGRTIFSGKIIVPPGSDFTDAEQLCRSLLLSEKAQVDAMPVLEIATDEVKASHGATVSDLSDDELFYCQSRGLPAEIARRLLIAGFVKEILADCSFKYLTQVAQPIVDIVASEYVANKQKVLEMSSI